MEPDAPRPTSWWQTLPGVVTAVAALLTALGGLVLALSQAGLLSGHAKPPAPAPAVAVQSAEAQGAAAPAATAPQAPAPPAPGGRTVGFPPGAKLTLGNNRGQGTYELLAAALEPRTEREGTLTLQVRLTNAGPADIGFWNDSFRLVVDGVPRAPISRLNSSVDARSAKEAAVVFTVPLAAKTLKLAVNSGDEDGEIPLTLK